MFKNHLITTLVALIAALASGSVSAQVMQPIQAPAGLDEGTETKLTPDLTSELRDWANSSQSKLQDLLETSDQMTGMTEVKRFLRKGIETVVLGSAPRQTELLMRYVLNRAMKASDMIERESDVSAIGVVDQQVRILRNSVQFAIQFAKDDLAAIENARSNARGETIANLPYAAFGVKYSAFLMDLDLSITDASAQYDIALFALGLLQWDLYRDEKHNLYAKAITKLNDAIAILGDTAGKNDSETVQKLGQARLAYQQALKVLPDDLRALASTGVEPADRSPPTDGESPQKRAYEEAVAPRNPLNFDNNGLLQMNSPQLSTSIGVAADSVSNDVTGEQVAHAIVQVSFGGVHGRQTGDSGNNTFQRWFMMTFRTGYTVQNNSGTFDAIDVEIVPYHSGAYWSSGSESNLDERSKGTSWFPLSYQQDIQLGLERYATAKLVAFDGAVNTGDNPGFNFIFDMIGMRLYQMANDPKQHFEAYLAGGGAEMNKYGRWGDSNYVNWTIIGTRMDVSLGAPNGSFGAGLFTGTVYSNFAVVLGKSTELQARWDFKTASRPGPKNDPLFQSWYQYNRLQLGIRRKF